MMYLLMTMFMLCGFIAPVCAGEKINIPVCFYEATPRLVYFNSKGIKKIQQFNIQAEENEPFFSMEVCDWKIENENKNENELKGIDIHIPFKYFLKDKENYKSLGSQLFSFSGAVDGRVVEFIINLDSNIAERRWPKNHMDFFRNSPNYYLTDEKELLAAGIIAEKNGKIVHGPNGYFSPEELLEQTPNVNICPQEKSAYGSSFSFKNFCYISIIGVTIGASGLASLIIFLYVLYKELQRVK
jgi:hypothetical protein